MKSLIKGVSQGLPQTGLQGGAGVGVFYLHRMLTSKVAFLQNNPLATPLGFVLLGHMLKKSKKLSTVGAALIGAGGYAGAQIFEVQKSLQNAPSPAASNTSGFDDDTGALIDSSDDVGALMAPGDIGDIDQAPQYDDAYSL